MRKIIIFTLFITLFSNQFLFSQNKNDTTKHPILTSKFQLGVGLYIPIQRVKLGIDGNTENQEINFGDTYKFNNSSARPDVSFEWRFAKKWKLSAEYFNANYAKKAVLEEDITIGNSDYTFNSGSNVKIGYKVNLYRIYVGTLISSGLKHELGGGLGAHVLNIGPFIEGDIIVNDGSNEFKTASVSATAPLPNIALWYHFAPNKKWSFSAKVDWFALSLDEYSGSLWDVAPSVRYQIIKNFAIDVNYRYFNISANVNKKYWEGNADLSFSGPTITLIGNL